MAGTQQPPARGVSFRMVEGRRGSTPAGRASLAAAAAAVDPQLGSEIEAERDWRRRYGVHLHALVEAELRSPGDAGAVPRAGLDACYEQVEFVRDRHAVPLTQAVELAGERLHTAQVRGHGPTAPLEVPYRGRALIGDELARQVDRWVGAGIVEPSFGDAFDRLAAHPEWFDLSRFTVVVLGAGAELGPLAHLCRWGARVVPIDLPRPGLWERILRTVRAGSGTAIIPLHHRVGRSADDAELAAAAGVDLRTGLPELARWLETLPGPLTIGAYAYAHGAEHVLVALAQDALALHLLAHGEQVSLAGLLTPTDVYAVPEAVVTASRARYDATGPLSRVSRSLTLGRAFAPNYPGTIRTADGARYGVADAIVLQQGPNYALAKRLQRWRLRLARHEDVRVSANVAPATRTRSVISNRVLAAAYRGAPNFEVEVFEPDTASALMAALLAHDLHRPPATPAPGTPIPHELELFTEAAAHGGLWRNPYAAGSVLPLAAALGLVRPG